MIVKAQRSWTGPLADLALTHATAASRRLPQVQEVNLHTKRLFVPTLRRQVTMRLSTKALRTIDKYGIEEAAKKYECDLSKF
jgi:large subunit ribosomal protein L28